MDGLVGFPLKYSLLFFDARHIAKTGEGSGQDI